AVATHYGARRSGGVIDGWLVETSDAAMLPELHTAGIRARAVPLMMTDVSATAAMAAEAIDLAGEIAGQQVSGSANIGSANSEPA
ncbi:MAG: hypothetical protein ACKOW5_15575, partial [Actinomycetales bacterium]